MHSITHTLRAIIAVAFIAIAALGASAQKGESCFGLQTGFTSNNRSAIAGLFYQYGLSSHLRIAPEMGCVFRHHDKDAFTVDLNCHVPLAITSSNAQLYPLAGLNFSSWNHHHIHVEAGDDGYDDVSTRKNKLGVNVGAGFQLMASAALKLKVEAKYTITTHYSTFVLGVGIGYVF